jgi:FMN phosphatase YigB (HAD superfamily)
VIVRALVFDVFGTLVDWRSGVAEAFVDWRSGVAEAFVAERVPGDCTELADGWRARVAATLSNGHLALLVDLARNADLRFDCQISAELAGAYKPASDVYLTATRLLAVPPGELMLVAAHPRRPPRDGDLEMASV